MTIDDMVLELSSRLVEGLPFLQYFQGRTRRRKFLTFLFIFVLLSLGLYTVQLCLITIKYYNPPESKFTNNYFLSAEEVVSLGYLVHTPTCSILNLSAWDEAILPILIEEDLPPANCRALSPKRWTYTLNSSLVINVTALRDSGFSMSSISCCYFSISRVTQSLDNYDTNADSKVRFSDTCTPLTRISTPLLTPFVRVHCKAKYWPLPSDVLYRRFHAVSLLPDTPSMSRKVNHWKTSAQNKPPNVLIIGIDSMSRLGFHRTMPKTRKVLENLGAVEQLGYTKVGENTLPNVMAALGGYPEADIREGCFEGNWKSQDACMPYYLFERFSTANYTTALIEDAPYIGGFNYLRTGFVQVPTDFYLRPFMVAVQQRQPTLLATYDCVGSETVDEIMLRYISDVTRIHLDSNVPPLFLFSWMTNLAHGNLMGPKYADDLYAQFISDLDLSNTILFVVGDHGYRFGQIRQTFPGWYEDKLPNFWTYLPPTIQKSQPHWLQSLKLNTQRLSSTFDFYWTLNQILDEFANVPPLPLFRKNGQDVPRKYGQSLFSKLPLTRKCGKAGIGSNFCACVVPKRLPLNDTYVEEAAVATIIKINSVLPPQCAQFALSTVDAAAVLNHETLEDGTVVASYVVAFHAFPGQFQFEATVNYRKNATDAFYKVASDVLRMNAISTDVSCVQDSFVERLCYCATDDQQYSKS